MEYRSVQDLERSIKRGLSHLVGNFDLVVGVPRSGFLAGLIASRVLNLPLTDVDCLERGRILYPEPEQLPESDHNLRVLVMEDSVQTGGSLALLDSRLKKLKDRFSFTVCAVYGRSEEHAYADMILETVQSPRLFQWNQLHHGMLEYATVDLDEVILGPGWDGGAPVGRPTKKFGFAITNHPESRLADIRRLMNLSGVEIGRIVPLKSELRLSSSDLARRKAEAYLRLGSFLYVAGCTETAEAVAAYTGKPALCLERHILQKVPANSLRRAMGSAQAHLLEASYLRPAQLRGWFWKKHIRNMLGAEVTSGLRRFRQAGQSGVSAGGDR